MKRSNWTDDPCFYVSIIDGKQFNVVAGPFRTDKEAEGMVDYAREEGCKVDPWSHFYS